MGLGGAGTRQGAAWLHGAGTGTWCGSARPPEMEKGSVTQPRQLRCLSWPRHYLAIPPSHAHHRGEVANPPQFKQCCRVHPALASPCFSWKQGNSGMSVAAWSPPCSSSFPSQALTRSCPGAPRGICSYSFPPTPQPGLTLPHVSPALGTPSHRHCSTSGHLPPASPHPAPTLSPAGCPRVGPAREPWLPHSAAGSPSAPGRLCLAITPVPRCCAATFPSLGRGGGREK